jgi:hypothetical protein
MISQGGLWVSKKELMAVEVVEKYRQGELSRKETALKLERSERQVTRLAKAVREKGLKGLTHGNRGRSPANRKSEDTRAYYVGLYRSKYLAFNFLHAFEQIQLNEEPKEKVSYSVFVGWCRKAGLGKVRKRRSSKARIARERMANEGILLQMDGSPHKWNGKDEWTLINVIDDATSKLTGGKFALSETTFDCMEVMKEVIETHGVPEFLLTDRAGWSKRVGKRAYFSQFERACNELGITIIATSVPETKGRVERSFKTCQDRLVAEMDLHGIKSLPDANRYLKQVYVPGWNERFAVEARAATTRFKPLPPQINLGNVFCLKQSRLVNRDHTVHYGGKRYKLTEPPHSLWKKEVIVHEYRDGSIKIFYGQTELRTSLIEMPKRVWRKSA